MKNLFVIVKKKYVAVAIALLMIIPLALGVFATKKVISPKPKYTIVIDAGHGGRDVK